MKCHDRMEAFRMAGKTVLLVSHALDAIRTNCRRALWIHEGRLVRDGEALAVTGAYHDWSVGNGEASLLLAAPVV
jgi:ABC-type polysaccharide/polyol phosphate transport system ATPase subunit